VPPDRGDLSSFRDIGTSKKFGTEFNANNNNNDTNKMATLTAY